LEAEKFQVVREIDKLKNRISEDYPTYYQVRYDSLSKNLNDFKSYCYNNGLVGIEYFWGDSALYWMITDGEKVQLIKSGYTKDFINSLKLLLYQLSYGIDLENVNKDFISYNINASEVYRFLLGEAVENLGCDFKKILIIPDGLLAQLPFEALITHTGDTTYPDYSSLPYLINESSLVYAYSVNLLLNSTSEKNNPGKDLLAFSYSGLNALADRYKRSDEMMELPHTAVELRAIKKVFRGKNEYYYNEDATEHLFKIKAPEYQILHLAVHGMADTTEADNSRLIFKHGMDTIDDSNLYMYELYGLDLSNTRLAVLSACETGIGKDFRGEGIFSMARGFTYAGCPAIIMSLWPVRDIHTASIMEEFYRNLKKGQIASDALHKAKLNYLKKQESYLSHPVNWASFVYLGGEFTYQTSNLFIHIITTGLSILILMIVYLKFFRYKV
jgi:CHAT domain-containing protein